MTAAWKKKQKKLKDKEVINGFYALYILYNVRKS